MGGIRSSLPIFTIFVVQPLLWEGGKPSNLSLITASPKTNQRIAFYEGIKSLACIKMKVLSIILLVDAQLVIGQVTCAMGGR